MPKIPKHIIDQVREKADILEVVSEVVQLKKRGKNYFALCPFHHEKTPSFSVNPEMGIYHCFGCGRGGNVITFVMEYEKIDFVEAVKRLADRYGIRIEYESGHSGKGSEIGLIYELHDIALSYYERSIFKDEGKKALEYLYSRGFDESVVRKFRLGYAPDRWDGLFSILDLAKFTPAILKKSGLFILNDKGIFYDRFRNRIMFPIYNLSGRVVAFAGRALAPGAEAKYMNSPETPVYFKSRTLFGLNWSKDAIRKLEFAIVVEGYTDFIRVFESGYRNVVAVSGTAFNENHARVLRRFTSKVVLCYDSDEAGKKAAERAGYFLLREEFDVKVVELPEGEDPDSFIKSSGKDSFGEVLSRARSFFTYVSDRINKKGLSPGDRARAIEELAREIAVIKNPVFKDIVLKQFAENLRIAPDALFKLVESFPGTDKEKVSKLISGKQIFRTAREKAEYELIKLMIYRSGQEVDFIFEFLNEESFKNKILSRVFAIISESIKAGRLFKPSELYNYDWADDERAFVSELVQGAIDLGKESDRRDLKAFGKLVEGVTVSKIPDEKDLRALAVDCIINILSEKYDERIGVLRSKIKEVESKGGLPVDLLKELNQVRKERKEFESRIRSYLSGEDES